MPFCSVKEVHRVLHVQEVFFYTSVFYEGALTLINQFLKLRSKLDQSISTVLDILFPKPGSGLLSDGGVAPRGLVHKIFLNGDTKLSRFL
jgi:hypothetical protein